VAPAEVADRAVDALKLKFAAMARSAYAPTQEQVTSVGAMQPSVLGYAALCRRITRSLVGKMSAELPFRKISARFAP
jgi:hypothetical protein